MATTVTYKGQTLATVDNQTKTLQTAGKWCEDDFTLTDVSGGGTGEWTTDGIATNAEPSGAITLGNTVTVIQSNAFQNKQAITSITGNAVTEIKSNGLNDCRGIVSASFPNLTTVGSASLENLRGITSFNAPNITRLEGLRFWTSYTGSIYLPNVTYFTNCYGSAFKQIRFPSLTTFDGGDQFRNCSSAEVIDIGSATRIPYESAFINTNSLLVLIMRRTGSITSLGRGSWGTNTPTLYNGTCKIYVPSALISTYQTATNWSNLPNASTQFVALEGSPYEDPEFIYAG